MYVNPNVSADRSVQMSVPVIIYSIVCAACLYRNWSSIMSPVLTLVSIFFISFCLGRYESMKAQRCGTVPDKEYQRSKLTKLIPYYVLVFLLSVALCMTDSGLMIFGCNVGILMTELYAVISYFNDTSDWGIFRGAIEMLVLLFSPIKYISIPFADRLAECRRDGRKKNAKLMYIILGLAIALPMLAVMLSLLSSADPVFREVINDMFGRIVFSWDIVGIVIFCFEIFLFVYGIVVKAPKGDLGQNVSNNKKYVAIVGSTITIVLTVFYLLFVVVQIVYLFMNKGGLPDGMTYSRYARNGFYQLLIVAILNVLIVLLFQAIFEESVVLKSSLFVMCICTYVMIASAAVRMCMYIEEYDLTYLRLNTLWMLTATGVVLLGVIIKLFSQRLHMFSYIFFVVMILFTAYAFMKPGAVIARYNTTHTHAERRVDMKYLLNIGNDGMPYVTDYLEDNGISPDMRVYELNSDTNNYSWIYSDATVRSSLEKIKNDNDEDGYVRSFNFSRFISSKAIENYLKR